VLQALVSVRVSVGERQRRIRELISTLVGSEDGATAAEYAVLIALIAAVIFVGAQVLGTNVDGRLTDFGTDLGAM
jgi:Flp pilus assembly pilin Flp